MTTTTTTQGAASPSSTTPLTPRGLDWPEPTAAPADAGREALTQAPQAPSAPAQDVPAMSLAEAVPVASEAPQTFAEVGTDVWPAYGPGASLPNTGSDVGLIVLLGLGCGVAGLSFLMSATRGARRARPNGAMSKSLARLR